MTDPREIDALLEYFQITPEDTLALRELAPAFEENADACVQAFYHHLLRFPATQRLLRDPAQRERLLVKQREYLLDLASADIDAAYVERRSRIGAVHERIGVDTRWYLGAYALYFLLLLPVVQSAARDADQRERATAALVKRLYLDAELAIQQYVDRREEDLVLMNRELSQAGRELSREVGETTRRLRRTEARARAAEQLASVATLVTGLAHEVGTPMGVIRGHAEALEGAVEGERATWRLQMILDQIDRITSIIESLLNMARPKESLRIPVDVEEVIETSLAFLTEKLRRRDVAVEKSFEGPQGVVGDPEKLQQVFLNLFINAIDAMPDGGRIRVRLEDGGSEDLAIRVTDTGVGIEPDQLETIFDPFYTTKPAGRGNGLGLVVVEGIVKEHGGAIEAHSEPGKGTEFLLRLPIQAA